MIPTQKSEYLLFSHKFLAFTKVIVTTGNGESNGRLSERVSSTELINLGENTNPANSPNLPNYPMSLWGSTGVFIDDLILICGGNGDIGIGSDIKECYKLTKGVTNFSKLNSMIDARAYARSVVLEDGHVLVTGGSNYGMNGNGLRTAETIDPRNPSEHTVLDMLKEHMYHEIINLNVTTYFIIGGCTDLYNLSTISDKTYYYNHYDKNWTAGPVLSNGRMMHTAGVIYDTVTKNEHVVVVGGRDKNNAPLNSVEILYNNEGQWAQGK